MLLKCIDQTKYEYSPRWKASKAMFTQKPCLPVSAPRKRKHQIQSQSSMEVETPGEQNQSIFNDTDADVHIGNDSDRDSDVDSNDENDDSDSEMNAAAYLYSVREEARLLPDLWTAGALKSDTTLDPPSTAENHTSPSKTSVASVSTASKRNNLNNSDTNLTLGSIASLQYLTSHRTKIFPPPTLSHLPLATNTWVDQTLADFSQLRLYLERSKFANDNSPSERQPVPPMKDFMAWYTFCIGRHHNFPRGENEKSSTTIQSNQDTPAPAWETNLPSNGDGHSPCVRLLLQMDQVMVRRVLQHLTSYVDRVSGDNRKNGCYSWIYALLARLERPIHRDDAVTMFTLLKRLTLLRFQIPVSKLLTDPVDTESLGKDELSTMSNMRLPADDNIGSSNDRQYLATLNTLIAIVGVYFEQGGNYAQIFEVPSPA